jgi:hypothetical protein
MYQAEHLQCVDFSECVFIQKKAIGFMGLIIFLLDLKIFLWLSASFWLKSKVLTIAFDIALGILTSHFTSSFPSGFSDLERKELFSFRVSICAVLYA